MSSVKQYNLRPYDVISATAVIADVISEPTDIFNKDNIIYQYEWTGTLVGTFDVQTSLDYNPNTGLGTWDTIPLGVSASAAGTPDSGTIEMNQMSAPWIRTTFTFSSGTGNLSVSISAKAV